jgi:TatD-related deoxyribonuclease
LVGERFYTKTNFFSFNVPIIGECMIIYDNHLHLRRDGRYLDAVKEFIKAGGTHFTLCQYPMVQTVIEHKSYGPVYRETLVMAEEIRKNLDVTVYTTVGPYPIDYLALIDVFGRVETIEIMKKGMDQAAKLCEDGECIAIGEIGRPHFPVESQVMADSNEILAYGMKRASEVGTAVVLHTETTTSKQCEELVHMGRKVGLSADKIVKHFAPPLVHPEENHGLIPSVLASRKNIEEAAFKGTRFMMETDYIDDPRRPGAVLSPKTVPKRTFELLRNNKLTEDELAIIHQENPEKTYNISME